jgi:hypothetical protein
MKVTDSNSVKDLYYKEIKDKKEKNELLKVFTEMRDNPDKNFNCHDIAKILNTGTNTSSRIFRKLEINGLIKNVGLFTNDVTNKSITHYKIIPNVTFNISKDAEARLKHKIEMKKNIKIIVDKLCNNHDKIKVETSNRIMHVIRDIIAEIQKWGK